jgi:hypothetical protein
MFKLNNWRRSRARSRSIVPARKSRKCTGWRNASSIRTGPRASWWSRANRPNLGTWLYVAHPCQSGGDERLPPARLVAYLLCHGEHAAATIYETDRVQGDKQRAHIGGNEGVAANSLYQQMQPRELTKTLQPTSLGCWRAVRLVPGRHLRASAMAVIGVANPVTFGFQSVEYQFSNDSVQGFGRVDWTVFQLVTHSLDDARADYSTIRRNDGNQ